MEEPKHIRKSKSVNKKGKKKKKIDSVPKIKSKRENSVNNISNSILIEDINTSTNNITTNTPVSKAKKKKTLKKKKSANKVKSLSKGETIPVKQIDPDDIEISILNISQLEKNNVSQTEKSNRNSSSNDVTNIASPFNNDNSSIEQKNDISDIKLSFEYNIKDILYRKKKDLIDRAEYLMKEENLSHYTTEIYFTNKKGSSYILSRLLIIGKQLIVVKEKKQNKEPKELTEIKPNRKLSNVIPYTMKDIELFYSPLLLLNFDLITAKLYINQKKDKLIIYVLGSKKYFKIKFKSKDIFKSFSLIINDILLSSKGAQTNLLGVSLRENFDTNFYISSSEFAKKAKSGDCLIFRGFECPAKCQRCFTRAEYDHVALLQRRNDVLYVYESTSKDGTKARNWREFTAYCWNLLYDKMVFRELLINLPEPQKGKKQRDIEIKLENFIKATEGKKYILNVCSILCGGEPKDYEKKNDWKKSNGFFCSQLLIASYIASGIVTVNKESGSYLPGDFSDKTSGAFKLAKDFYLGPEIIIDFTTNNP